MTHHQYVTVMAAGTAVAWLAVGLIVFNTDPALSSLSVFAVFYAALILALTGTATIIGFVARRVLRPRQVLAYQVSVALRQGVLSSLFAVACLILNRRDSLGWVNGLLLLAILTMVELFFMGIKGRRPRP